MAAGNLKGYNSAGGVTAEYILSDHGEEKVGKLTLVKVREIELDESCC